MNQTSRILEEVKKAVCGKDRVLVWVLTVLLARGHVLLEDIPGVGKTTMALAFSRALGLDYGRVQFTPDVLPSDITGYSVYQKESGKLVYQPGAVLCNLFLADELNRATSRTQSALLEAMEEGQVTVDGVSHPIPQPFIVFATQNPTGAAGFVVACAECGLEYSSGRADIKGTAMNLIKGFMAASLFSVVPVKLYELCVSLQANFGYAISGAGASFGTVAGNIIDELTLENFADFATTHVGGFNSVTSSFMVLFCIILMAYAVIKVFFANLKRGGILLIQIAVGSLYMFSVPRGYLDGFYQWCKQVVGLCLTAFLQATILIAGLSLFNEHALLGLGLMLSAGEIPRIAGAFGLDTSTRANLSSAVYTAQTAINITKTVAKAAAA